MFLNEGIVIVPVSAFREGNGTLTGFRSTACTQQRSSLQNEPFFLSGAGGGGGGGGR